MVVNVIWNDYLNLFCGLIFEEYDVEVGRFIDEFFILLMDKDVMLRLVVFVVLIEDGYICLLFFWIVFEFGFNLVYLKDELIYELLIFGSLLFWFYLFEEGLFIVEVIDGFEDYIGV